MVCLGVILMFAAAAAADQGTGKGGRLEAAERFFNDFGKDRLGLADEFYDARVHFQDPVVDIQGLEALKACYASLSERVRSIRFVLSEGIERNDELVLFWKVELRADGLKGGDPVILEGASHIRFGGDAGKAVYHQDYFDMGAFVYENISRSWDPPCGT